MSSTIHTGKGSKVLIALQLDQKLHEELLKCASKKDRSKSWIVRRALIEYLQRDNMSGEIDEDVYEEN